MAVNLLTFDNYALPKLVVTSNIDVSITSSTLYITANGFGNAFVASNIGTSAVYGGTSDSTFLFRGLDAGSGIVIDTTATNLVISNTLAATSLGSNAVYAASSNILQFLGITAGTYVAITPSSTTLQISYTTPIGVSFATSLGSNAVYAGTSNNVLQFTGISAGSYTFVTPSTTSLLISYTDTVGISPATSLGNNAVYAGSSDILQFLGIAAGSYTSVIPTATSLLISCTAPIGSSAATSLGNNAVYVGSSNILQFLGITAGSYTSITPSATTLLISYTGSVEISAATSLGTNAVYAGTSNNILQFLGIAAGTYASVTPSATTLLISYAGPVGNITIASSTLAVSNVGSDYTVNLASGIVTPGSYGSASLIPSITVDTYGRVTAVTTNTPADAGSVYAKMLLYNTSNIVDGLAMANIPQIPTTKEIINDYLSPNGWTFGPTSSASISMPISGRLTYTGATTRSFLVSAAISIATDADFGGVMIEIRKNGENTGLTNNFFYCGPNINSSDITTVVAIDCAVTLATNNYVSIFIGRTVPVNSMAIGSAQLEIINVG